MNRQMLLLFVYITLIISLFNIGNFPKSRTMVIILFQMNVHYHNISYTNERHLASVTHIIGEPK